MRPPTVSRDVLVQRLCVTTLGLTTLALACTRTTRTIIVAPTPQVETVVPGTAATLAVPPGHLPKPGECRVWIPDVPPGRQPRPKSRDCAGIEAVAPPGSWILYRPTADRRLVHVREVDRARVGVVVRVRIFEVETGRFVREENP
jgi:hypothetical protein